MFYKIVFIRRKKHFSCIWWAAMTHWNGLLEWIWHLTVNIQIIRVVGPVLQCPNRWIYVVQPDTQYLWASTQARFSRWVHIDTWRDNIFETSRAQMFTVSTYLFMLTSIIAKMKENRKEYEYNVGQYGDRSHTTHRETYSCSWLSL